MTPSQRPPDNFSRSGNRRWRCHHDSNGFGEPPPPKTEESSLLRHPMNDEDWHTAAAVVRKRLAQLEPERVSRAVEAIEHAIGRLDGLMDRYCALTCPSCEDPCCSGTKVFFNLTDLIALAARNELFPPGQTRTAPGLSCRYLGPCGCALDRFTRPYVCVWFLCEPQMELLDQEPVSLQREVLRMLQTIRIQRLWLETLYEKAGERLDEDPPLLFQGRGSPRTLP